jgi:hypothetical protein
LNREGIANAWALDGQPLGWLHVVNACFLLWRMQKGIHGTSKLHAYWASAKNISHPP